MDDLLQMLFIIAVLAGVFWLTWAGTKFIAKRSGGRAAGRFMRVVDRLNVSNDKAILLVKIGRQYSVIGMTGHEMSLIRTLDADEAEAFDAVEAERAQERSDGEHPLWTGVQTFGERLGLAMKRNARPRPQRYTFEDDSIRGEGTAKPQEKTPDEQSVIDMMNERIRLRKESKWK